MHIWNGAHIVGERNASGIVTDIYYRCVFGRLTRSRQHGWYLLDGRGSVVQRTNDQRAVLHTYRYAAFGIEVDYDPNNTNPFRFNGEFWDRETQTYYLRARHFNPRTGRFTQPDPHWGIHNMIFGDSPTLWNERYTPSIHAILQSGNLYVFGINNPIRWIDPSGLFIMFALAGLSDTPIVPFCPDGGIDASSVKKSLKIKNQILQKRMQNRMNNSSGSNSSNTGSTTTANTGQARAGGVAGNTSNVIRATTSSNMSRFNNRVQQAQTQIRVDQLPQNAQNSFRQYSQHGWQGNVSGHQGTGTASGRAWANRDGALPQFDARGNPITYREFDVNTRVAGAPRDAQRFIVGSDGSIFFTDDHYLTFFQIN